MVNRGKVFVISGPSGAGKSSLIRDALMELDGFIKSISVTTRPMRNNEEKNKHYKFITESQFQELIQKEQLLEWAQYCGYLYGTPIDFVYNNLEKGINVILEIEVQGAMQVKKKMEDAYMIFITTGSLEELRNRLLDRNTDEQHQIDRRLLVAEEELKYASHYDCIIVNNNYNEALLNLKDVLLKERGGINID
ncbi:MAG: guanylate kinase [Actinomycetota bacterium]|jgi:guanylate kinase|nr:guanylate kinase [Actinomycetota bacterium]